MQKQNATLEQLLTCEEAAPFLGAKSARFARRLIAERRIRFVRVGRNVRSESREEIVGTQPMLPPRATSPGQMSEPTTDAAADVSSLSSSSGGTEPVVLPQVEAASGRARGGR